ncbi:MAG TPA: hypothetical protein VEY30_06865, partial [Myxococcaceae bacterium]|nr:hypothetical protein [Myxococcaceae bacterium]
PMGAHPQPLYVSPSLGGGGYADDFAQYEWWRAAAAEPDRLAPFVEAVLKAEDGAAAYQAFVHRGKSIHPERSEAQPSTPPGGDAGAQATPAERRILRAARRIAERVREAGYPVILAGVGHAFFAARLAQIALEEEGRRVEVLVETGLEGVACGPSAHGFLLSHANMAQAARLSSVEHALGALTCGADNRCLGVIGAAQVDAQGNVNSTRLADGGVLVGSGGANDICSSAAEVVVLSALSRSRLVPRVDHLTSPGRAVRSVVTEACVFARDDTRSPQWTVVSLDAANTPEAVRGQCPWPLTWPSDARQEGLEDDALALLRSLDPDGRHTRRD